MKSKRTKTIVLAVCFVCGAAIGYLTGERDPAESDQQAGARTSRSGGRESSSQPQAESEKPQKKESVADIVAALTGDPIERMEKLMHLEGPKSDAWEEFLEGLDGVELRKVAEEFGRKGYSTENWTLFMDLWDKWSEKDPVFFLEKSLTFELYPDNDKIPKDQFLHEKDAFNTIQFQYVALKSLAATDPQGAIQWAMDHYHGEISSIIDQIAKDDVNRAFDVVCSLQDSIQLESALKEVTDVHVSRGTEKAYEWAFGIKDEKLRAMAIANITSELATTDSKGAAAQLVANPGKDSAESLRAIMSRMSKQDFNAAVNYFGGIEDEVMKSRALEGLITEDVAGKDPDAVISLMDANPSAVTDEAALTLVKGAYVKDAELAVSNIRRIRTPELRQEAYRVYMLCWMRDDSEKARAWVKSNGVPEDMRLGLGNLIKQFQQTTQSDSNTK